MNRLRSGLVALAAVAALGAGGAAVAGAAGDDDGATEKAITGPALERASQAAIAHLGGGEVTDTEVGDEESYYEVEVTTADGQVDVQLDREFDVVGTEGDDDNIEDGS